MDRLEWEPFTPEEIHHLVSLLKNVDVSRLSAKALRSVDLREALILSFDELDLEALASSLAGVMDPIGQIQDWFQDQLSILTSWFASTVDGIFRSIWETVIKPFISTIASGVDWIKSNLTSIADSISATLGQISTLISDLSTSLSTILESLANLPSTIWNFLQSAVSTIKDTISGIVESVSSAVRGLISNLQNWLSGVLAGISQSLASLTSTLSGGLASIMNALAGLPGTIINAVTGAISGIQNWLSGVLAGISQSLAGISTALTNAVNTIISGITQLPDIIGGLLGNLQAWLGGALEGVCNWIVEQLGKVTETLGGALKALGDALSGLQAWLSDSLSGLQEAMGSALASISDWIGEATKRLQDLGATFQGFVNAIANLPNMLGAVFGNIFKPIADFLGSIASAIQNFFADPIGTLSKAFQNLAKWLWDLLPDWLKDAIEGLKQAWDNFVKGLQDFLKDPLGFIQRGFSWLADQIWKLLPDWLKGAIQGMQQAWDAFVKGLQDFLKDPLGFIQKGFSWLAGEIWKLLPDWLKGALESIKGFFEGVWKAIQDFVKDPWGSIQRAFEALGKWIWDQLPEPAKKVIEKIRDWIVGAWDFLYKLFTEYLPSALNWAWNELQALFKNPLEYIWGKVTGFVKWLAEKLSDLWGVIRGAWEWFINSLRGAWDWLINIITAIPEVILGSLRVFSDAILGLAKSTGEALAGVYASIVKEVAKPFEPLVEVAGKELEETLKDIAPFEALGMKGPCFVDTMIRSGVALMATSLYAAGIATIPLMVTKATKAGGHAIESLLDRLTLETEGHMRLIVRAGVSSTGAEGGGSGGGRFGISSKITQALGKAIRELGDAFDKYATSVMEYTVLWTTAPVGEAMGRFAAYYIRDLIPVQLPSLSDLTDFARRVKGLEEPEPLMKALNYYASLYGYSSYFVEQVYGFTLEEEKIPHIEVRDRFFNYSKVVRKIPIALIYTLPSASDIAAMMVRDIFFAYDDFIKLAKARGMPEDIAALYYIYRFKYPSPSQLFKFYWRGVAGVLWYAPPELMTKDERETLLNKLKVGAEPKKPTELNFKMDTLREMISTYMKWHDLFPAAWEPGYTSDRAIVMDLSADMPDKIDVRWMLRYALFEYLAQKGIKRDTDISKLRDALEGEAKNKAVFMDLSLACRLLQARGLHPYFVPFIAVADTVAALADERTLLRTGFINLYERGALDAETLDKLLASLVIASFKVSYYDVEQGVWVDDKYINLPVAYLPAERKLIAFRALLDKFERPWREVWTDLEAAYREYILEASGVLNAAKAVAEAINELLPKESKALVGTEVTLSVDEGYLKTLLSSWEVARKVYTIRRIRSWVYRILGWVIYRAAYGYVRPEDLSSLAKTLASIAQLPKEERRAIEVISREVWRVALREYIPTPSQLATMAEILPKAARMADEVLEARNVPEEWRALWKEYIEIKPIANDVYRVVSYYYRAKRYGVALPQPIVDAVEKLMERVGYTDEEKAILDLAALIYNITEEMRKPASEVIPSLGTLASMAEYIDVPLDYVSEILVARNVEKRYAELWLKYVSARTIASEVNRVSSTLRSMYEYYAIPQEVIDKVTELMSVGGWTSRELEIFKFDLELRRRLRILRTLVPTLREFMSDAMYLGEWEKLLEDWLRARGIEAEKYKQQVEYYRKLIKSRKINRRLSWYITRVMNAFCAGVITKEEARRRLERFKTFGLDDDEIEILLEGFELEKAYREAIYGSPTGGQVGS
mgnify:FL=1